MRDLTFSSGGLKFDYLVTYPERTKIIPTKKIVLPIKQDVSKELSLKIPKGAEVEAGEIIAEGPNGSLISPIDGKITQTIENFRTHWGDTCTAIEIESLEKSIFPREYTKDNGLLTRLIEAGIIDLQEIPRSLFSKLEFAQKNKVDTLIINGLEEIIAHGKNYYYLAKRISTIEQGIKSIKKLLGVKKVILALYNDYKSITNLFYLKDVLNIDIVFLKKKYPQHHSNILVRTLLKKDIPSGRAIEEVTKATVLNLETIFQLGIISSGFLPYREKIVTVVKGDIRTTELVETVVGTSIKDVLEAIDVKMEKISKIVVNGCISGHALTNFDYPITKDMSSIYLTYEGDENTFRDSVCIKCGLCVEACPMNLMPLFLYGYAQSNVLDFLKKFDIHSCIECGCCAYVCPVNIPIPQWIKYGKANLKNKRSDV